MGSHGGTGTPSARRWSRRDLGRNLLAAGLAVLPIGLPPRRILAAGEVGYFTWAGYEIPELHGEYVRAYGGSPWTAFFSSEDEGLQKLRYGYKADLAHPCSSSVMRWYEAGAIKPIEVARLRHWPDVIEPLQRLPGTIVPDGVLWIPFDWGSNSVVYRTDLVDPKYAEENSWMVLWDERYAGHIGMWDSVDGAIAMSAAILGIADTATASEADLGRIRALLSAQQKLVPYYWDSETLAETSLASGEYVATYLWSASAHRLRQNGVPVDYMLSPKEGIVSFACGLVMLADGTGDEQAKYDFIDAMLSPESGKYLVEEYGYGHSNRRTYEIVSDEALAAQGLTRDVTAYIENTSFFQYWPAAVRDRYIELWEEIKRS